MVRIGVDITGQYGKNSQPCPAWQWQFLGKDNKIEFDEF
jgi:hypothetical protein